MTALLHVDGLTLFRGERCLFNELSFDVRAGEALLVQGPNGSGKTSLLAGAGRIARRRGRRCVLARTVDSRAASAVPRGSGVVRAPRRLQERSDRAREFGGRNGFARQRPESFAPEVLERLSLTACLSLPFRALSAGQQRRVGLARMLLCDAPLWLMDEPLTNLDRSGQQLLIELVTRHVEQGGLCVFASHQDIDLYADMPRISLG